MGDSSYPCVTGRIRTVNHFASKRFELLIYLIYEIILFSLSTVSID